MLERKQSFRNSIKSLFSSNWLRRLLRLVSNIDLLKFQATQKLKLLRLLQAPMAFGGWSPMTDEIMEQFEEGRRKEPQAFVY